MKEFAKVYEEFVVLEIGEVMEVSVDHVTPRITTEGRASYTYREGYDCTAYPSRNPPARIVIEDGHHSFTHLVIKGEKTARVMRVQAPPEGTRSWDP